MHTSVAEGVLFCVYTHYSGKGKYYFVCMHFSAKVVREIIFKPTIGQESLHQNINDNGVRIVNIATSKNLVVKSTMFAH